MSTKNRHKTAFGGTKIPDACSHTAPHVTTCVIASSSHAGGRRFMQADVVSCRQTSFHAGARRFMQADVVSCRQGFTPLPAGCALIRQVIRSEINIIGFQKRHILFICRNYHVMLCLIPDIPYCFANIG